MPAYEAGASVECSRTRSRSEYGASSPRPYPRTATRAPPPTLTPASCASSPSQPSVNRASALRRAGPGTPVRLSNWARNSANPPAIPTGEFGISLQGFLTALAGAYPHHGLDRNGPDLAITDLAGAGGPATDVDDVVAILIVDQDFQPDLRQQLDRVLRAAVDLGVAALAAVAGR